MNRITEALGWLAAALAAIASAVGLLTASYRDTPAMVDQARGADLATLLVAVPVLVVSLWRARRGSPLADVAVAAGLAYIVYTYAIFAFQVVVNPLTPAHIAILGLAAWALALGMRDRVQAAAAAERTRLPRRTAAGFLAFLVVAFAGLWLSQIGQAIATGSLPEAVADLGVPTSAVYALDLAFVLPVFAISAVRLLRGSALGQPLAFGCLVFSVLMALSILGLFAVQAARGTLSDPSMSVVFAVISAAAAVLAALGARPTRIRLSAAASQAKASS